MHRFFDPRFTAASTAGPIRRQAMHAYAGKAVRPPVHRCSPNAKSATLVIEH